MSAQRATNFIKSLPPEFQATLALAFEELAEIQAQFPDAEITELFVELQPWTRCVFDDLGAHARRYLKSQG